MSVLDDRDLALPRTAEDVMALCAERDVRFVRLWFTDVLGQLKSFSVGRDELPHAFAAGAGFDGSSITGFNAIEESDMVAQPDPATFALLPWVEEGQAAARMIYDVRTPEGPPYEGDPPPVPRRAPAPAAETGLASFRLAPEPGDFP